MWCQEVCYCRAKKKVPHLSVGKDKKGHISAGLSMLLGTLNINSCKDVYGDCNRVPFRTCVNFLPPEPVMQYNGTIPSVNSGRIIQ